MSEAFSRKIATIVDLDIVRTSTLSALHNVVGVNAAEITKFWKRPDANAWRDLRTHPQYGPVAQWLYDVEETSCELKYELVAELGGDWSLLGLLLCDELSRRGMG